MGDQHPDLAVVADAHHDPLTLFIPGLEGPRPVRVLTGDRGRA